MSLAAYRQRVVDLAAEARAARAALANARAAHTAAVAEHAAALEARTAAQTIAATVQQAAHARITAVVGHALGAVFDAPYEFRIDFVERRGKTEAEVAFVRGGHALDPLGAAGGGACDVAAFALRAAAVVLRRPPGRRLLVLDEPFRHLKPAALYGPRVTAVLEGLADSLDVQIIMVSHVREIQPGLVIEI